MGPKSEVMIEIMRRFNENDIMIPYPHQVQIADPALEDRLAHIEQQLEALQPATPKRKPKAEA